MSLKLNILASWIAHAVMVAIGFYMVPFVRNTLPSGDYGVWVFVNSIAGYSSLLYMGLGATVCRFVANHIPGQRKSHDRGIRSRAGQSAPADHLLMIQGPLSLDWQSRKYGLIPRIENADIHEGRPPAWRRFQQWMNVGVHVADRPNWKFIKLHTHGCKDGNIDTLLGPEMQAFHASLADQMRADPRYRLHYVTAWEMALLVRQAESGVQNPMLSSSTRFRLEPGGITPHRDRSDGRRKSDASPRVVTRVSTSGK